MLPCVENNFLKTILENALIGNVNLYIRQQANFDSRCRILEFGCRILEFGNFQNSTPNSWIRHPNSRMSKLARCRIYRFTFPLSEFDKKMVCSAQLHTALGPRFLWSLRHFSKKHCAVLLHRDLGPKGECVPIYIKFQQCLTTPLKV